MEVVKPRWAVFISGRGSNFRAILDLLGEIDIPVVVSNVATAPGLQFSADLRSQRKYPIEDYILSKNSEGKLNWHDLDAFLRARGVDFIFLAGFMKILPAHFIEKWSQCILNVHPSLLPTYPGLNSMRRAFDDRADMGITVHVVTAEVDAGEILLQKKVLDSREIQNHSFEEAEKLMHACEHELVREAIRLWSKRVISP